MDNVQEKYKGSIWYYVKKTFRVIFEETGDIYTAHAMTVAIWGKKGRQLVREDIEDNCYAGDSYEADVEKESRRILDAINMIGR